MKILEILEVCDKTFNDIKLGEFTESNNIVTELTRDEYVEAYVYQRHIFEISQIQELSNLSDLYKIFVLNDNISKQHKIIFHAVIYKNLNADNNKWHIIKKVIDKSLVCNDIELHTIQFNFTFENVKNFLNRINLSRFETFCELQQDAWKLLNLDITSSWNTLHNGFNLKVVCKGISLDFIKWYYDVSFKDLVTENYELNITNLQ